MLLGGVTIEPVHAEIREVAAVQQSGSDRGHQGLPAVTSGGEPLRHVHGSTEVAVRCFIGLAGVQPDPQPQLDTPRPGFAAHRQLQLGGPRGGVVGPVERRSERLTADGEQEPALPVHRGPHQLVEAGHRRGRLLPVRRPQPGGILDLAEAERHRPRRTSRR